MTDREIMKQALDFLVGGDFAYPTKLATDLRERLAQPEQEPVAWLDGPHLVVRLDMRNRLNYQGPWVDLGRAIPDKWTPFLYTAPPQSKPLTDNELADLWYKQSTDWLEFARAIEAAHGIKGS